MRPSYVIGAIGVALAVVAIIQFWPADKPQSEPVAAPISVPVEIPLTPRQIEPEPVLPVEEVAEIVSEPEVELPALAESDDFLLAQIQQWSLPSAWLQREDLLSRAAVIVQNAADGRVPRQQIAFLTPAEAFQVVEEGEQLFVDPVSYTRYDTYIEMLEAIPPAQLAKLVNLVAPLLGDAFALLGDTRRPRELLLSSLKRIVELPELPDRVALLRPAVMYIYADPRLEALPEFDKQLLRMGPENISRLQSYLIEFKGYYLSD